MKRFERLIGFFVSLVVCSYLLSGTGVAVRLKDICTWENVRTNQLIGYGLVVGLNGSGDKKRTQFTINSLTNMLNRMGVHVNPNDVNVKNVAAVVVTAELAPFARVGTKLDVTVSSIGDATTLEGGTLLLTPLAGPDKKIYAVAQGPVSVGGFSVSGGTGSKERKNYPTVGRIPEGATVESEIPITYARKDVLDIFLNSPDFTTATRAVDAINNMLHGKFARAIDAATIRLSIPDSYKDNVVPLLSNLESLDINPDTVAKVVIDERTGTVVIGENVQISKVAVSYGSFNIQISEQPLVSQPAPFGEGETAIVPSTQINTREGNKPLRIVEKGVKISDVVKGLNAIGARPRDLIIILQAIKAAGALQAQLELI